MREMQTHFRSWLQHGLILSHEDFPAILHDTCMKKGVHPPCDPNDLACLEEGEYLNDSVLWFYLALVEARAAHAGDDGLAILDPQTLPNVRTILSEQPKSVEPSVRSMVYKWFVKRARIKPHAMQVLIPCNITNHKTKHWLIARANVPERTVTYYCSNGGAGTSDFNLPIRVLFETLSKHEGYHRFGGVWLFQNALGPIPQQADSSSCGLYVCAFADYIARGMEPSGFGAVLISSLRAALKLLGKALQ